MWTQLQLPIDTTCYPSAVPPAGARPAGPPVLCTRCPLFSAPYSFLTDDPLGMIGNPDRRDPLCLCCTIATVQKFRREGLYIASGLEWADAQATEDTRLQE